MGVVTCPNCAKSGRVADDYQGTIKCPKCGNRFSVVDSPSAEVEPPPNTKPCPFCSEEILLTATKCKHCGEFLAKPRRSRLLPLLAGVVGLVVVASVVGFLVLNRSGGVAGREQVSVANAKKDLPPPFRAEIFADLYKALIVMETAEELGNTNDESDSFKSFVTELKIVADRCDSKLEKECVKDFETIAAMEKDISLLKVLVNNSAGFLDEAKNLSSFVSTGLQQKAELELGKLQLDLSANKITQKEYQDAVNADRRLTPDVVKLYGWCREVNEMIKKDYVLIKGYLPGEGKDPELQAAATIHAGEIARRYDFPVERREYTEWLEASCKEKIETIKAQLSETLKRRLKNGGSAG